MTGPEPEHGEKKRFLPCAWSDAGVGGLARNETLRQIERERSVTGTVVYVNRAHRWYRVRYPGGAECFKY